MLALVSFALATILLHAGAVDSKSIFGLTRRDLPRSPPSHLTKIVGYGELESDVDESLLNNAVKIDPDRLERPEDAADSVIRCLESKSGNESEKIVSTADATFDPRYGLYTVDGKPIIFIFWDYSEMPWYISLAVDGVRCYNEMEHHIAFINESWARDQFAATLPTQFNYLTPVHKSDYIRGLVLEHYGGMWIDADTVALAPSLAKYFHQLRNGFDIVGYSWLNDDAPLGIGIFGPVKARSSLMRTWKRRVDKKLTEFAPSLEHYHLSGRKQGLYPLLWTDILSDIIQPLMLRLLRSNLIKYAVLDGPRTWGQLDRCNLTTAITQNITLLMKSHAASGIGNRLQDPTQFHVNNLTEFQNDTSASFQHPNGYNNSGYRHDLTTTSVQNQDKTSRRKDEEFDRPVVTGLEIKHNLETCGDTDTCVTKFLPKTLQRNLKRVKRTELLILHNSMYAASFKSTILFRTEEDAIKIDHNTGNAEYLVGETAKYTTSALEVILRSSLNRCAAYRCQQFKPQFEITKKVLRHKINQRVKVKTSLQFDNLLELIEKFS